MSSAPAFQVWMYPLGSMRKIACSRTPLTRSRKCSCASASVVGARVGFFTETSIGRGAGEGPRAGAIQSRAVRRLLDVELHQLDRDRDGDLHLVGDERRAASGGGGRGLHQEVGAHAGEVVAV